MRKIVGRFVHYYTRWYCNSTCTTLDCRLSNHYALPSQSPYGLAQVHSAALNFSRGPALITFNTTAVLNASSGHNLYMDYTTNTLFALEITL